MYALFAVIYYKERLYGDASYFIFHLINDESFRVEHQRFVQLFFQLFPLIGVKLALPYKFILILYSLGNVIYFYVITAVCVFLLKDRLAALAIIILLMFGTAYLYFCPIFEIWYGLAIAILFYSMLHRSMHLKSVGLILMLLVETLALFSHPLTFFILAFFTLLDILDRKSIKLSHILFFLLIIIWAVVKPMLLSEYEGGKMDYILNTSKNKSYLNLLSLHYVIELAVFFYKNYFVVMIMGFLCMIYFRVYGYRKHLLVFSAAIFSYIVFINVTHVATQISFYIERLYLVLIPMTAVPFVYYVFGRLRPGPRIIVLLLLISGIIYQFNLIPVRANAYTERVEHTQRLINYTRQFEGSKFVINEDNYRKRYNDLEWSLPVEAILYSTLEGKEKSTTICTSDDMLHDDNFKKINEGNFLFRRWDIINDGELNAKYFSMQNGKYFNLNEECCIDRLDPFFNSCVEIEVKTLPYYEHSKAYYVRVHVNNMNETALCSNLEEKVYLSYHWYQGIYPVVWDGLRSPIEVNLINEHSQDIEVLMPEKKGTYTLVVDVLVEYRGWFGADGRSDEVLIY
ncbi:MAG: hypothetical protein HKN22_07640 [Bacteroidia bacterium]|nr:hypothetical protein [Bacteroidia bacterium]